MTSAILAIDNFDDFVLSLLDHGLVIEMELTVSVINDDPELIIQVNDEILYCNKLGEGNHSVQVSTDCNDHAQLLRIGMLNKQPGEIIVDGEKIIKDKFIMIDKLKINNYNMLDDPDMFYNKFLYRDATTNQLEDTKQGFWKNAYLELNFTYPFALYYNHHSNKNAELAESMQYKNSNFDVRDELYKSLHKLVR